MKRLFNYLEKSLLQTIFLNISIFMPKRKICDNFWRFLKKRLFKMFSTCLQRIQVERSFRKQEQFPMKMLGKLFGERCQQFRKQLSKKIVLQKIRNFLHLKCLDFRISKT